MPTLAKPSSSFLFILVSLDFDHSGLSYEKTKKVLLKEIKKSEVYGAYYTILKSYRQSLDANSHICSLLNFENVNKEGIILIL